MRRLSLLLVAAAGFIATVSLAMPEAVAQETGDEASESSAESETSTESSESTTETSEAATESSESSSSSSTGSSDSSMGGSESSGGTSTAGEVEESSGDSSKNSDGGARPGEGAISISLSLPDGGNPYADGTAGAWYMLQDNINLGINLGLGIESQNTITGYQTEQQERQTNKRTGFDLLLAPALRYYLTNDSSIAPYAFGQMNFHKYFDGDSDTSADPTDDAYNSDLQPELALIGGFGIEWFPVKRFSIGGHVGMGFDLLRQNERSGTTLTRNGLRIGTFTSSLNANLYFE